jgi:hypothetical protein
MLGCRNSSPQSCEGVPIGTLVADFDQHLAKFCGLSPATVFSAELQASQPTFLDENHIRPRRRRYRSGRLQHIIDDAVQEVSAERVQFHGLETRFLVIRGQDSELCDGRPSSYCPLGNHYRRIPCLGVLRRVGIRFVAVASQVSALPGRSRDPPSHRVCLEVERRVSFGRIRFTAFNTITIQDTPVGPQDH